MSKKSDGPPFPLTMPERKCVHCEAPAGTVMLERCPMCQKEFCTDCAYRLRGHRFCSQPCGHLYLYGDEDEANEDADEI